MDNLNPTIEFFIPDPQQNYLFKSTQLLKPDQQMNFLAMQIIVMKLECGIDFINLFFFLPSRTLPEAFCLSILSNFLFC